MFYRYRFLIVITLIVRPLSSKAGKDATFLGLPDSVICEILSKLDGAIGILASCNTRLRGLVKAFRDQSEFAVVVTFDDGKTTPILLNRISGPPGQHARIYEISVPPGQHARI